MPELHAVAATRDTDEGELEGGETAVGCMQEGVQENGYVYECTREQTCA